MLYITQVSLELAAPKIKRIILTNFENEDQKEKSNRQENIVSSAVEEVIEQEEQQVEEKIEEKEEQEEQEPEPVRTVPYNKSFKDMNNDEKIHFTKPPSLHSESKVQNKTATVSYVGSIISYRNGIVSIMPQNSMRDIRLSIDDIQSISMAGFNM